MGCDRPLELHAEPTATAPPRAVEDLHLVPPAAIARRFHQIKRPERHDMNGLDAFGPAAAAIDRDRGVVGPRTQLSSSVTMTIRSAGSSAILCITRTSSKVLPSFSSKVPSEQR